MRVVLDAYWWVRGTQSLRHVVHGLTEAWAADYPGDELVIVVRRKHITLIEELPANVTAVPVGLWPQALSAMFAVPWHARRLRADAMLSHNFSPQFGRRRAAMVQDVMFVTRPEWFTRKELLYYRWMVRSARRAEVVFSSTDTEGSRLRQSTRAKAVVRAGMGLSDELINGTDDIAVEPLTPGRFILAVGRLNIRKNLRGTLEGARESGRMSSECPLVIVGERDGEWDSLPPWVQDAVDDGSVLFTGFVAIPQLRWLIRNSGLYVCLSLDEGFGLPPVEALVLGAQVLVSDIPVFRETLQADAAFVDPLNANAVGRRIAELLDGEPIAGDAVADRLLDRHNWPDVARRIRSTIAGLPAR